MPLPGDTIQLLDSLEISPISAAQIRKWTARDPILSKIIEVLLSGGEAGDEFQPYLRRREKLSLQDGRILRGSRVVVPEVARQRILEELHEGHPGISRMKGIARGVVWWPGESGEELPEVSN